MLCRKDYCEKQTCRWSVQWTYAEQRKQAKCSIKPCPAHSHIFMPSEQERKAGKFSQKNRANTVATYTRLVNALHTGRNAKKCNGMNHFANVCQGGGFRKSSKPVDTLRSEADTEGTRDDGQLFVGTLFIGDIQANDWQTKLRVNDTPVT